MGPRQAHGNARAIKNRPNPGRQKEGQAMLEEKDLQAIAKMMDEKLAKLKADILSGVNKNVDEWGRDLTDHISDAMYDTVQGVRNYLAADATETEEGEEEQE